MARRVLITRTDFAKTGTFSGGSWVAAPLDNLKEMNPQKIAQSTDALSASTKFDVDFGSTKTVGLIGLLNNDTNSGASLRVRLGTVADFSSGVTHDTGTVGSWPSDVNGTYTSDEYAALGKPRFFIPSAPVSARYARVEWTGVSGQVKLGAFCACQVVEPARNIGYGWEIALVDESDIRRVPFGSTYITSVTARRRRLNFGIKLLSKTEAMTSILPLSAALGKSVPLIMAPDPDDTDNLSRTVVYGLFSQDAQFANPFFTLYDFVGRIEQLI